MEEEREEDKEVKLWKFQLTQFTLEIVSYSWEVLLTEHP